MKTKLLYTLVSSPKDNYLEMAHISITSAKYHMPDSHVVLIVDDVTDKAMDENRKKILENVDEYIIVPLPKDESDHIRSRLIKCGSRKYVKGDYLYMDVDTIVVKSLYEIDNVNASIAAVNNLHHDFSNLSLRACQEYDVVSCEKLGFPIREEKDFFNGGIIFVKDDDIANKFYEMWLDEYKKSCHKGIIRDQPSLMKTNYQMGHVIQHLEDIWNVQIVHGIKYLKDAKICHYYTSGYRVGVQSFVLRQEKSFLSLKEDLYSINSDFYRLLMRDPFVGLSQYSRLITGNDFWYMNTWLCNTLYYWYCDKRKRFERIQSLFKAMVKIKQVLRFRKR